MCVCVCVCLCIDVFVCLYVCEFVRKWKIPDFDEILHECNIIHRHSKGPVLPFSVYEYVANQTT
jgi:hypothetical protein